MPWSNAFIAELAAPTLSYRTRLDFLDLPNSVNAAGVVFTSDEPATGRIAGFSIWSGTLTPSPCQVTTGGFVVTLAGNLAGVLDDMPVGAMAALSVDINGATGLERVALGRLEGIRRQGLAEVFTLTFSEAIHAMQTRLTKDTGSISVETDSKAPLFYTLDDSGMVYSLTNYTPGLTATLTATSGAGDFSAFERESGQDGLLRVEPPGGEAFYLLWSGKVSSTEITLGGGGGQRSTTPTLFSAFSAGPPPSGTTLFPVALIRDHPAVIFMKILTSTGTAGTGGIYDTLPEAWGIDSNGVAEDWLDVADISAWYQEVLVTDAGSAIDYVWDLIAEQPWENALKTLVGRMLQVGIFPTMRQGDIVLRALQDLNDATTRQPHGLKTTGLTITDDDIIEVGTFHAVSPSQEAVSRLTTVLTGELDSDGETLSVSDHYSGDENRILPARKVTEHDASGLYFAGVGNHTGAATADAGRLLCWDALPREELVLVVRLRFAQLCKGDVVLLTTTRFYGALVETRYGYDAQPMLVLDVRQEWLPPAGPTVTLTLATVTVPAEG